jgi:hypothetical protein
MARKITIRKISDKSKKKEIEKKIRKALSSSGKVVPKKKKTGKVTRKEEQNAVPKKIKEKVKGEKKSTEKQKKAGVKVPEKKKTEKVEKKKEKILPRAAKTIKTRGKPEKPEKKPKTKTEIKVTKMVRAVVKKKKQPAKAVVKARSKIEKEVPAGKRGEIDIPKSTARPAKKVQAEAKPAIKKKPAQPAEKEKKIAIKVEQKIAPAKVSEAKKVRAIKTVRRAAPLKELKEKVADRGVSEEAGEMKTAKELYPEIPAEFPPVPWETLPSEYGENAIALMMVNPYKLFVFWEVREDTLKVFKGVIQIRVYDITGIDFDREDANSFFDLSVNQRIGKRYIDVVPEREYLADIGIVYEGIFITIARSGKVLTPRVTISEEGQSFPDFMRTVLRIGY